MLRYMLLFIGTLSLTYGGVEDQVREAANGWTQAAVKQDAAALGKYLAFTRAQESTADASAVKFLHIAGISGKGMLQFFGKLQQEEYRLAIYAKDSYDRTHPLSSERVASLTELYQKDPAWNRPIDAALEARFDHFVPNPVYNEPHPSGGCGGDALNTCMDDLLGTASGYAWMAAYQSRRPNRVPDLGAAKRELAEQLQKEIDQEAATQRHLRSLYRSDQLPGQFPYL